MGRLAMIDGEARAPEDARVSVYDRGFLYGDSVFETIRTYGGKLFQLEEHIDRLERSARQMGIDLPLDREGLLAEARRAVTEAGNPESYVRYMVSRGRGPIGLDPRHEYAPTRVVLVEPLVMPPPEVYRRGVRVACVQTVRASDAADSAKLGNYLASALALRSAREAGADEALVVNRDGLVVEGTTSNVFAWRGGKLSTPAAGAGVLPGITRGLVIDVAEAMGLELVYEALAPEAIAEADEIFLTSSIRELMPVVEVDGQTIGTGAPGDTTRAIHRAFRAHVGVGDAPLPWA